jgi:hypothetical protein
MTRSFITETAWCRDDLSLPSNALALHNQTSFIDDSHMEWAGEFGARIVVDQPNGVPRCWFKPAGRLASISAASTG